MVGVSHVVHEQSAEECLLDFVCVPFWFTRPGFIIMEVSVVIMVMWISLALLLALSPESAALV